MLRNSDFFDRAKINSTKLFSLSKCNSKSGIGLSIIYKIRNDFAHGDFLFPSPDKYDNQNILENDIYLISSQIILLSMQMMIIAENKNTNIEMETPDYRENEKQEKLIDVFRLLHYYDFSVDDEDNQLLLF